MIFAVDPGSKGAIVWGVPGAKKLESENIPQISDINNHEESEKFKWGWMNILKRVSENNRPDAIFLVERTEPFFSAKANPYEILAATRLAREQGRWDVATLGFRRYNPVPATWRKSVFGGARVHRGHDWKIAELEMAIKRFPSMEWGKYLEFRPKNDHGIYGLAAACCIWIYGEKLLLRGGTE